MSDIKMTPLPTGPISPKMMDVFGHKLDPVGLLRWASSLVGPGADHSELSFFPLCFSIGMGNVPMNDVSFQSAIKLLCKTSTGESRFGYLSHGGTIYLSGFKYICTTCRT
jgi:hypothetical protein